MSPESEPTFAVPLAFAAALRAGELDGVQFLLGVYIAFVCAEAGPGRDYEATIALSRLVSILNTTEAVRMSRDTCRRALHDLERGEWLACETGQGQRVWKVRLTGLRVEERP